MVTYFANPLFILGAILLPIAGFTSARKGPLIVRAALAVLLELFLVTSAVGSYYHRGPVALTCFTAGAVLLLVSGVVYVFGNGDDR